MDAADLNVQETNRTRIAQIAAFVKCRNSLSKVNFSGIAA
jgi:hypothetical protein